MNRSFLAILTLLSATSCCWAHPRTDFEHHWAERYRPPEPAPVALAPETPLRALRLRVYADDSYRAHVLRWETKVREIVDRANDVLGPAFRARLVPEMRPWTRPTQDPRLDVALAELQATDPGSDTDWVLGLTGLMRLGSNRNCKVSDLGQSKSHSKYMVELAMDDADEAQTIDQMLTTYSDDQRYAFYRDRKRYKEVAILITVWAETLGAVPMRLTDKDLLTGPLGSRNRQIVQANLDARMQHPERPPDNPEARAVVRKAIELDGCPDCDPKGRAEALGTQGTTALPQTPPEPAR